MIRSTPGWLGRRLAVLTLGASLAATLTAPSGDEAAAFSDAELIDASVNGVVFVDFDRDGRVDAGETTPTIVSGQRITVASTNRQERARSGDDGTFSLTLPNLVAEDGVDAGLRIEMATPDGYTAGFGTDSIQHLRVGDDDEVTVLFGLIPDSSCPDDPTTLGDPSGRNPDGSPNSVTGKLWTACFVDGAASSTVGAQDVLVAANVDATEWEPPLPSEFGGHLDVEHLATKQQMGAIWGIAYDEWDGVVYASAVIKRHSDLGPEGVDGLYWRSSDGDRPEVRSIGLDALSPDGAPGFGVDPVDCPRTADGGAYDYDSWSFDATALGGRWDCRDLSLGDGGSDSYDWWAFDRVGRVGIGDIDITPDGNTLLVLNATADAVFVYDIRSIEPSVPNGPTPRYVRHHDVIAPECIRGRIETWGLTAIDAVSAYVGVTCTADGSDDVADLSSQVLRLDIVTGQSTAVVSVFHDHPHGPGYVDGGEPDAGRFRPWLTTDAAGRPVMPPLEQASSVQYRDFLEAYGWANAFDWPQPLLSDIEIDPADGSLVLAVMDRWPLQTGVFNCDLDPSTNGCGYEFPAPPPADYDGEPGDDPVGGYTGGVIGYVAGDLLRVCNVSNDPERPDFVLEGGPGCDPSGHSPAFVEPYGGGPAGEYEWYWNDQAFTGGGTENPHPEAAQGAVAQLDQFGDIVYTAMNATETFGAGLSRDAHSDGAHVAGIQFFRTDFQNRDGTGWKSAGLGDVEGCTVPLEIGDHVWFDQTVDGARDPQEPPIPGVAVTLVDAESGFDIATKLTDESGHWSFSSDDGLEPLTDYLIRFTVGGGVRVGELPSFELVPTVFRAPSVRSDLDSDLPAPAENGLPLELRYTTGEPGANDRSIDAGFAPIGSVESATALANESRPGPPWTILGILFGGAVLLLAIFVLVLKKFVW